MSQNTDKSRGAQRREEQREQRTREESLAWWRSPGVLIFLFAVALMVAGWALIFRDTQRITSREGTIDGLYVKLQQARWVLDQMDHGENFQKPSVMMPDMPAWGLQRVTLDLAFENRTEETREFDGGEFVLVPQLGDEVLPMGANTGHAVLLPGQSFNTALHFDFDARNPHGRLMVEWRRDGESIYLPVPAPAEHYHLRPRGGEVALPPTADLVIPLGRASYGKRLYLGTYGCIACHGAIDSPGSNNVGPHLSGLTTRAETRLEGVPGKQYIYESIIYPNTFIAPECKRGPCGEPSAMPEYSSLMSIQDLADILVYLIDESG